MSHLAQIYFLFYILFFYHEIKKEKQFRFKSVHMIFYTSIEPVHIIYNLYQITGGCFHQGAHIRALSPWYDYVIWRFNA